MTPDMPEELSKALISVDQDELGLVLRSHLYIENLLDELLSLLIPFPEHVEEMSLTYANKVRLACAMGLDRELKSMLLVLGAIRNKFSHNLHQKIDSEMVKNLHGSVHENTRKHFPEIVNKISENEGGISSFNQCHPRDQFTALVISLWIIMNGAILEVKDEYGL